MLQPRGRDIWVVNQVLSNLVGNALKFTPAGGAVNVIARLEKGKVRFEVTDTGFGIAPEHLPHVFERYWKSDGQGRRGVGLGLYVAKGIVESHNGRIWVDSRPGIGTSFQFELPILSERSEKRHSSPIAALSAAAALQSSVGPGQQHLHR